MENASRLTGINKEEKMSESNGNANDAVVSNWYRLLSYLIDLIVFAWIVVVLNHLVHANGYRAFENYIYILFVFRDIVGASPGKIVMGLRVTDPMGAPCNPLRLILRNVTLALGPAFEPAGFPVAPLVSLITLADVLSLLGSERRIGDWIAGTKVVRRPGSALVRKLTVAVIIIGGVFAGALLMRPTAWKPALLGALVLIVIGNLILRRVRRAG